MPVCAHTIYLWLIECKLIWKKKKSHSRDTPAAVFEKKERKGIGEGVFFI